MPYISVIVPACNSSKTIGKCLEAINNSDYKDYELIVVDCSSRDDTVLIAGKYACKLIKLTGNSQRRHARINGIAAASGELVVSVDSDIVIKPHTLAKIYDYFSLHDEVDALTGLLAKEHPHPDFFSQYKNLYMNYIFQKLPERVNFLYGSLHAFRRGRVFKPYCLDFNVADDTALGQQLIAEGKRIAFLKELEVVHLKRYNLFSFIENDFKTPFAWAKIFLKYKGWKQLGRKGVGFAHSPREQLVSVILAPLALLALIAAAHELTFVLIAFISILLWLLLNFSFMVFLKKEKGFIFAAAAFPVTFIDNIIMALGITSGLVFVLISALARAFRARIHKS